MKKLLLLVVILILASCYVNTDMVWQPYTTYNYLDRVLAKAQDGKYWESYVSLMDGNTGYFPPDNPAIWGQ